MRGAREPDVRPRHARLLRAGRGRPGVERIRAARQAAPGSSATSSSSESIRACRCGSAGRCDAPLDHPSARRRSSRATLGAGDGASRRNRARPAAVSPRLRRPGALPRVRAAALRRRPPVPPCADPRARGSRARGRAEPHLGQDAGLPLQLVQLRLQAPAAVRVAGRAHGAQGRRPDRRLPRVRRRHGRADRADQRRARRRHRPAVAVLAREAPRARARAARPGRDPERRRPGDLPSARGTGAARCTPRPHRRDELVGQSAEGRGHSGSRS